MRRLILIATVLGLVAIGVPGAWASAEGPDVSTRIVGSPADAVQSEWQFVSLVSPSGGLCAGSVVAPRWILTAAHCTFDSPGNPISSFALYPSAYARAALPPAQAPDAVRVYPSYVPNAFPWDFALMRLPTATATPGVAIPAPSDDAAITLARAATPTGARNGRIAGWGSTGAAGSGPYPPILQTIPGGVPILVDSQCNPPEFQAASMVCAGGFPTSGTSDDTCRGDSGGPLAADINGRRLLIGLTSFGPVPCGNSSIPGVYSKVQAVRDWICDTVTSPTAITATADGTSVDVAWSPDATTCPWRDPSVSVSASPGGASTTVALSSGSARLTGLAAGTAYSISAQVVSSAGATPPAAIASVSTAAPAPTPAPAPTTAPCSKTFYQQDARTARNADAPDGTSAVRVVSRLRIYEDAASWCRVSLTFMFRDTRNQKRLSQLPGSALGHRKLTGKDFSAPVVSWPTMKEFRFEGSDSTGLGRKDARLVLVSYLERIKGMPAQSNVELMVVRRIPTNAATAESATNPLFAQKNSFGTVVGWATVS